MPVKKKDRSYRILSTVLILAVLLYVGFQIYRSIFDVISTEMAVNHSVYESIETKGLVFRNETIIPMADGGHIYYTVENGTRVSKGGVIASVYPSSDDGRLGQQIAELEEQIDTLRAIAAENATEHLSLDLVRAQLADTINNLVRDGEDGVFVSSAGMKSDLMTLLSKQKIITGESIDFTATIAALEEKKASMEQNYHSATSTVKAPVAGYFADQTDGYETLLASVDPTALTVAELNAHLTSEVPAPSASGGKIVSGYEWFMACVVPDSYYNALTSGTDLSLRMSFVTDEEIPVTVASCRKDNDGNLAVVFCCAYMSEALSTVRHETVEIQLVKHTGLKVPKRAIVINEDMEAGVYIRSGNVVAFRKIDQIFSEPSDYVICADTDENGYLSLYDDIIVEGRGLYDGKIIH